MNRAYILLPIFLALALSLGFYLGIKNSSGQNFIIGSETNSPRINSSKLNEVIRLIDENYVDTINSKNLTDKAISYLLKDLDPHSSYIPPKEQTIISEQLGGKFGGIGVSFRIMRDTLIVTGVIDGGPSQKAGILAGDRIIKVDGDNIASVGINNEDVFEKLKGEVGTNVDLTIFRPIENEIIDKRIRRGSIPVKSVVASYMLTNDIGYIRFIRFSDITHRELAKEAEKLRKLGMTKLILDVRSNGGGYLEQAIKIADEFLEDEKLIVYTQGRKYPRKNYYASNRGDLENIELTILINETSASASEILAGAIQDNDRGTIIGRRSFGKGLVQRPFPFRDNSVVRITTQRYYTPTGRSIQKPYGKNIDYENDYYDRIRNGELSKVDSSYFVDSLKKITPQGKVVYGGGGIMPDIFVAIDSSYYQNRVYELINYSDIINFVINHVDKKRKFFRKYKTADSFIKNYHVGKSELDEFYSYIEKKGNKIDKADYNEIKDLLSYILRAEIGGELFHQECRIRLSYKKDPEILKAIEWLKE